jgi:hypothetical protein
VLAGTGLGDHALLAHALGEQRLADGVVHLVRAGVVEVFALEVDLRTAQLFRPALGMVDRARPSDVMLEVVLELGDEFRVVAVFLIGRAQLLERAHQRLGDIDAAVGAEMAGTVRIVVSQRS